ncbi:MAG TPA: LysR family transcriptional regulator [Gemmatimonadales bacterium]|nr:LysR family transcriptional regulator [Gemmatimonadales bacterium]
MTDSLDELSVFVAVAETQGFRAAGERLGVTGSAVSQTLGRLEERLGVPLLQRTTRSVRLTEAGERLYASVRPALEEVRTALASVGAMGVEPRGTLRLHVATVADRFLEGQLLAGFLASHPHVQLDLVLSDDPLDIVAGGFDAGIQLGEVIDQDMHAVAVTGDIRLVVVAAPSYLAQHPTPQHPRELSEHDCINWHASARAVPYRWEFTENGKDFAVTVRSRVLTTDPALNIRLARAGIGITIGSEDRVLEDVARGTLVKILDEYSTPFPGLYLYYPQRRQGTPALRALIAYLQASRVRS